MDGGSCPSLTVFEQMWKAVFHLSGRLLLHIGVAVCARQINPIGFENSARLLLRSSIDNMTHIGDAPKVIVRNSSEAYANDVLAN